MRASENDRACHSVNLADLVRDVSQVEQMDNSDIPAFLTLLSAVQASMAARLMATTHDGANNEADDALLTVQQAAERLGVSEDWLYRRTRTLPFVVRVGRHVRFSSRGIERFIRNRIGR
jgi:excisionase family DNA binding protein